MQISKISPNVYSFKQKNNTVSRSMASNSVFFGASEPSKDCGDKYYRVLDLIDKGCPEPFAMQVVIDLEDEKLEKRLKDKLLPEIDKFYDLQYKELQNNFGYKVVAEKVIENDLDKSIHGVPVNNSMVIDSNKQKVIKQIILDNTGDLSKNTTYIKDKLVHSWEKDGDKVLITIPKKVNDKNNIYDEILLQIEIVNGENGAPEYIIATKPSDKLKGAFETTKYILSDYPEEIDIIKEIKEGTIMGGEKLSSVSQNADGSIVYDENYITDGKKITKKYVEKGANEHNYLYEIKNKDGSDLFKMERSFQKNDDGTTSTIINGKEYITEFDDENFEAKITTTDGFKEKISISNRCGLMDLAKVYGFIKNTPADFILNLKNIWTIRHSNLVSAMFLDGCKLCGPTDISVLTHELGHFIDLKDSKTYTDGIISTNKEVIDVYNKEMQNFQKKNPKAMKDVLFYFSQTGGGSSKFSTGLSEMVADIHSLMFTYGHKRDDVQLRIDFLTKYFPETVAKVGTMLGYNQVKN